MRAAKELGSLTRPEETLRPGRRPPPKELQVPSTMLLGHDALQVPEHAAEKMLAVFRDVLVRVLTGQGSASRSDDAREGWERAVASGELAEELGRAVAEELGIIDRLGATSEDATDESAALSDVERESLARAVTSDDWADDLRSVFVEALGIVGQLDSASTDGAELLQRHPPRVTCIQELIAPGAADATLLKVALLLLWVGRHQPDGRLPEVPAALYAEALGLPDPDTRGARRVREAQKRLADLHLITRRSRRPRATELRLLDPYGAPLPPPDAQHDARVPSTLFTAGWIAALGGPALVVLIHIAGQHRGHDRGRQLGATELRRSSRLSKAAWYVGIDELLHYGLLSRQQSEQGRAVDRYFVRYRYKVLQEGLGRDASQRRVTEWRTRRTD